MRVWMIRSLRTGEVWFFASREHATGAALMFNRNNPEHPAFHLWSGEIDQQGRYEGRLWRKFGSGFDELNPWNPEEV